MTAPRISCTWDSVSSAIFGRSTYGFSWGRSLSRTAARAMPTAWSPIRSSSSTMCWKLTIRRRSRATGCWVAMIMKARSRSCRCSSLTSWSRAMTIFASALSRSTSARIESAIACSTMLPMRTTPDFSSASSWSKRVRGVATLLVLPEAAGDVILGPAVLGAIEDVVGRAELDDLARPLLVHQHECGEIGGRRRLLHVLRHDHDRIPLFEFLHEFFDAKRRDRIECRGRLIHQDYFGLDGERTGQAQPLLLASRKVEGGTSQPVLHLVPQPRVLEALFHHLVDPLFGPTEHVGTVGDIVEDRFREGVRPLEQHADLAAQVDDVGVGRQDVVAVDQHLAGGAGGRNRVIHPVEHPQKGRLATAGGADQGGGVARLDGQG